jgi:hypothetical protein
MEPRDVLTRRTLLGRAARVGAASLLAPPIASAAAASPINPLLASAARQRGDASVFARPLGSVAGESPPVAAPRRFVLVGVQWAAPPSALIELRARAREGSWSRWVRASVLGHDSDLEAGPGGLFGEPLWTGPADFVQLRTSEPVHGVQLHFVAAVLPTAGGARLASATALATPVLDAGPGQPPIITRDAWSLGAPPAVAPSYGDVRLAFVHHTDNPNGYGAGEVPAILYSIYLFHRYVRGWNDIGYNFVIDTFGRIWEARAGGIDQAVVGAQAGGYNLESTGVAILGTYSSVLPAGAALAALEHLLAWKLSLHGVPVSGEVTVEVNPTDAFYTPFAPGARVLLPRVAGHRDGCSTSCPGNALYAELPVIRVATAKLAAYQSALTLTLAGGEVVAASYLSLADGAIVAGSTLSASGVLATLAGAPLAGRPIELQQLTVSADGVASERTIAQASTGSDGAWSTALAPTANLLVRALSASAPVTASPLMWVAVAPAITLAPASYGPPPAAGTLLLTGTVTPHKPRVTIDVYDASGRHSLSLTRTVEVTGGEFRARLRLRLRPGRYWLRARTVADSVNLAGESARVSITI